MPPRPTRSPGRSTGRSTGRSREPEPSGADAPPDAKHYAIMGSLLVGPLLLVIILFVALSGGGEEETVYGPDPALSDQQKELKELTDRQKQDQVDDRKIRQLLQEATELHEQAKFERKRFYRKDDEREKTAAFKEATRILKAAKAKLDEAYDLDRRGANALKIENLQQGVQQDLHNIMKDKPIYIGD